MNRNLIIQLLKYIHIISAFALAVLIPFGYIHVIKFVIGTFLVSGIISQPYSNLYHNFLSSWKVILPLILFYFIHLVSILYSNNIDYSIFDLEKKLSILLVPMIFFINRKVISEKTKVYLLQVFVLTAFITVLAGLIRTGFLLVTDSSSQRMFKAYPLWVFYENLSVFLHSAYFSMYLICSVGIIGYLVFIRKWIKRWKVFWIILALFFIGIIIINSSRSGFLSLALLVIVSIFYFIKQKKVRFILLIALAACAIVIMSTVRFQKYTKQFKNLISTKVELIEKSDSLIENHIKRPFFWMASYEIIQDNFWFGVGNGDIKDELEKKYEEYQIADQLKKNYNPHNQFLATFVSVGFVGFILLVLVFLLPVIKAFREKNYLLLSFMAIVFVHALTESIFARLQGIIFFSFFYGLIMTLTTFGPRNKLSDRQPGNQNLTEKSSGS